MTKKVLTLAVIAALSTGAVTPSAHAEDAQAANHPTTHHEKKSVERLKKIVVTGSLIPTAEIETATPVITITAQDIKRQGFSTLYQALRAQPLVTGQVQGEQFSEGFTSGAQTISLLGLPPDFTLFMVNGHPLTDYPLLYNGEASFTDLSSIPLAMVSRVEIVPGNESSIYGSAAIAGVVNIILKQHAHGVDFDYQAGGYSDGGGASQRLQMVGGYNKGNFGLVYGLQYVDQQPIWGFQRPYTASSFSNPNPDLRGVPFGTTGIFDFNLGQFVDPNSVSTNGCSGIANQFGGTTVRFQAPTPGAAPGTFVANGGYLCGSPTAFGYSTFLNRSRTASGYLDAHYRLNQDAQAYATLLYTFSSSLSSVSPDFSFWEPNFSALYNGQQPGVIFNADSGTFQSPFVLFAPEDTGTIAPYATHFINRLYQFWGGVKGDIGESNWAYNAYYARSQNNLVSNEPSPVTSRVDAFFQNQFLGPQLGTASGYPVYSPNYNNLFKNFTPTQFQSFMGIVHSSSETYTQNVNLQLTNTDLFRLPAGRIGFAGVLQAGDQKWSLPANPMLETHEFWGLTGTSGGGTRNNYAAAAEFHVPIFSMLSADLSVRDDRFHNDGGSTSTKPTYKIALSFRPWSTLLLRANYSTAFRMPDMGYVFVGPSGSFETVTDYYQCELQHPGTPYNECSAFVSNSINPQIFGLQHGNPDLNPITAKSWGGGVVWSPTSNFSIKADYYDIRIANEVQYQSSNTLLLDDAQCLLGQIPTSSPVCQAAFAAITRAPANATIPYLLTSLTTYPINIARERVNGIMSSLNYRFDAGRYGVFDLSGQYNITLHHTLQLAPGAPTYDLLHDPFYDFEYAQGGSALGPEYKSIIDGTLTWSIGHWTTALTGIRYGRLPNFAVYSNPTESASFGAGEMPPWILYNATVRYDIARDATVTLTVNNLFNRMPPVDPTQIGYPYYDQGAYNIYGRSYFADFNYRF